MYLLLTILRVFYYLFFHAVARAVVGRCLINVSAAEAAEFLRNITNKLGMEEDVAMKQVSELTGLNQVVKFRL